MGKVIKENDKVKVSLELSEISEEDIKFVKNAFMENVLNESLMFYNFGYHNEKRYRLFYGIGKVMNVVKGDKVDLVYMKFGAFDETLVRLVVVYHNHARRQIMTLKRGQYAQVYGLARYFRQKIERDNKTYMKLKIGLYAIAMQGWFVPTMLDIKKMPTNEDLIIDPDKNAKHDMEMFESVLDQFLNE